MRIIIDATAKQYTCKYCNSVLEVGKKDIAHDSVDYGGYTFESSYYYCPCCGERNNIETK